MNKAEDFSKILSENYSYDTEGWLTIWKARNNMLYIKAYREKQDVDFESEDKWISERLYAILRYVSSYQIFSTDDTGLYFRVMTDHTMIFRTDIVTAGKQLKERITVTFTMNLMGIQSKIPMVIGERKYIRGAFRW